MKRYIVPIILLLVAGSLGLATCSFPNKSNPKKTQTVVLDKYFDNNKNRVYWPTDDWRVSSPEEEGMDPEKLELAKDELREARSDIRSLLIVKNGFLIFEEYFNGYTKDYKQDIRSATKSVLSALVGIEIEIGHITGVNQRLEEIFPEYSQLKEDIQKRDLKIEHLLTMSTGLDDTSTKTKRKEDYLNCTDWVKAIIDLPVIDKPGRSFRYDDGNTHILSGIITKLTGMSTLEFANNNLFKPIGITGAKWEKDPNGICYGGFGLQISPRDMAKIGFLYLNGGQWGGKQIITKEWMEESIKPRFKAQNPQTITGSTEYGYLWWLKDIKDHSSFFAAGYGGQFIVVIPDLDMVIVTTANENIAASTKLYVPLNVIEENIIDALVTKQKE